MLHFANKAWELLKSKDYKKTPIRIELLKIFEKLEKPISAYDLRDLLAKQTNGKSSNIVTIYRSLETFCEHGLIHFIASANGYFRCELNHHDNCSAKTQHDCHHSFLVCRECDTATEFFDESGCKSSEVTAAKKYGFQCESHLSEVIGLCASCQ